MSWAVAAVGAVTSYFGSQSAANSQADAMNNQTEISREQLDWNRRRASKFDAIADPLMKDEMDQSLSAGPTRFFAGEKGQFEQGMAQARNNLMERTSGTTGVSESALTGLDLEGAKGMGSLMQKDNQRKLALEQSALAAAQGQAGQAAAGANAAFSNSENMWGNMAGIYGNQAAAGMSAFGSSMDSLGQQLSK